MSNFMSNDDALQVLGTYAEDIKKGKGVIAVRETSPATAAHGVGEYIRYNGTTYKVKSAISIGDSLILNTNIEANGLPDGMTIFTPESSSGGGSGECELFPIQLTGAGTVGSPYTVDVTPAELGDALDAGKYPVIMQYSGGEYLSYPFTWMEDDRLIFEFERFEDYLVSSDHHAVRSNKVRLEVDGTDWDTISIVTRDFDLTTKADKVSGATNGNFAGLDSNGNLTDSGSKASDFLTSHQDISGKADKVTGATNGNFASLDANGNLVDSGKKASDFATNFSGVSFTSGNSSSGEHNANNCITNGVYYYTSNGPSTSIGATTNDGALYVQAYSDIWIAQIAQDYRNGCLFVRGRLNGTWTNWRCVTSTALNRATAVNAADTNYTTVMARGIYATTTDLTAGTTALTNGVIALVYE